MRQKLWTAALAALLFLLPTASGAANKADTPAIDPAAMRHLTQMCEFLKGLRSFSFLAKVDVDEVFHGGLTLQTSRTESVSVRRPDRLRIDSVQDDDIKSIIYDGATFTVHNTNQNLYTVIPVPGTIDAAMTKVMETYGVAPPLTALLLNDPCLLLTEGVVSGFYVGRRMVDGVACHHLAFIQKDLDWQIWIAEGDKPVPQKLVIVDKTLASAPNYVARFEDWKINPRLKDGLFSFTPPKGAKKMDAAKPGSTPNAGQ